MRRSKTLAAGTKGRIFVVLLIAVALYMVAITIDSPMLFVIGRSPFQEHMMAQAVILLVGFVTNTLVAPVALIGLSLVYFDQRVRKEGFDLLMLLGPELLAPVGPAPQTVAAGVGAAVAENDAVLAGDAAGDAAGPGQAAFSADRGAAGGEMLPRLEDNS
jgi:hypothetical protein